MTWYTEEGDEVYDDEVHSQCDERERELEARIQALEAVLRSIAEYDCSMMAPHCSGCAACDARRALEAEEPIDLSDLALKGVNKTHYDLQ